MTWRKRGLIAFEIIVVVVGLYIGLPLAARRMMFFQVRRIEVVGNRYLREEEIVASLHLASGRSTLDPLDSLRIAAAHVPGIAAAQVERRLPGTLRVTVLEEMPVALSPYGDHLVLVDHRGRRLPFDPSRQNASFPIADSTVAVAGLLARILLREHDWYDEIESARLEGSDVVIRTGAHRIRLRPDANEETLRGAMAVREYLSTNGILWVEIDARYKGRVFVQKGAV